MQVAILMLTVASAAAGAQTFLSVTGTVFDPAGRPVAGAHVSLLSGDHTRFETVTGRDGDFQFTSLIAGVYRVRLDAAGFNSLTRIVGFNSGSAPLELRLENVDSTTEQVIVSAGIGEVDLAAPDPAQKVMVREELLDANPGRPGAPVSLPGLPAETASGGIKAPQYFVPGVAGDHGEPIAQYIAVGDFLVPNNLSANAHGNGYADPNIFIPAALGSVATDGGAFNVLEGNHALNMAATYSFRPRLQRFITLTGDNRDVDVSAGVALRDRPEWVALEAAYGNGLLHRLEHRQQYKFNALRSYTPGAHEITLVLIGYYGSSYIPGLVPLGMSQQLHDTLDPRQRDQTHTALLAVNDRWKLGAHDEFSSSGFLRSYNLALLSNFGEGLIRQSEFRTAGGAEVRERHMFAAELESMIGIDYNEDDPRRDNLDHYLSGDALVYGPFVKVLANDLTIRDVTPYVALHGNLGRHFRFYAGLRNDDLLHPANSFDEWKGFENPKATLAFTPGKIGWLPAAALSIGQAFFTQDPRIGVAPGVSTPRASPFERSHSEQLVLEKALATTDLRLTLGRTTTTATLAKIDPDTGLPQNLGPGNLKYMTASARHQFSFGAVQGVFSKADARDTNSGEVTPEAPRTIFDALAALDHLPLGLHARGEYEYVGHKLLDLGGFEAVPVKEFRLAAVHAFLSNKLEVGANGMISRGQTGQTTETFEPGWVAGGAPPACAAGVDGIPSNFDCGTMERSVGVRLPSFIGASVSWRFHPETH